MWGGWGELEPESRDLRSTEPGTWRGEQPGQGVQREPHHFWKAEFWGSPSSPCRSHREGAGSQHQEGGRVPDRPPSCPSTPSRPRAGPEKRLSSWLCPAKTQYHFWMSHPALEIARLRRGDSCVPQHSQGAFPEPSKTVAEAELAGAPWAQPMQEQAFNRASICPERRLLQGQAHSVPTSWGHSVQCTLSANKH